jgi:hypothetical protein
MRIFLITLFMLTRALHGEDRPASVCDAANIIGLHNLDVSIQARLAFEYHGLTITGESCTKQPPTGFLFLSEDPGAPKVDFHSDVNALNPFRPYRTSPGNYGTACATLRGRLLIKRDPEGRMTSWTLVLRSVANVHPCSERKRSL